MRHFVLFSAIAILVGVTLVLNPAKAQPAFQMTAIPSPTASAQLIVLLTPTPSEEQRITELESKLRTLTDPSNSPWAVLADKAVPYIWPILLLFLIIGFRVQVATLLTKLASSADRAEIDIMGFKWRTRDVDQAIIEREILITGLFIAGADTKYDDKEMGYLASTASIMVGNVKQFPQEARAKILREAIEMAAVDGEIQSEEYKSMKQRAHDFGISEAELDNLIIEKCITAKVIPPPQLRRRHDQLNSELEQEA